MIAEIAPESDQLYFLDHGRRDWRFRPALPGEPSGGGVLVNRDGRRWIWPVSSAAAYEINGDESVLRVMALAVAVPAFEVTAAA